MVSIPAENETAVGSILLSSPPGQFDEVKFAIETACRNLSNPSSVLIDDHIISAWRKEWGGDTVPLASTIAHAAPAKHEIVRASLYKDLERYARTEYVKGSSFDVSVLPCKKDGHILLALTVKGGKVDRPNRLAADWTEVWNVTIGIAEKEDGRFRYNPSASVMGNISLRSHGSEGGNVHFVTDRDFDDSKITLGYAKGFINFRDSCAQNIVAYIRNKGEEVSQGLEKEGLDTAGMLKNLRRTLPITRVKMDWNGVHRTFEHMRRE
mmetsp:Transcript_11447/g.25113  ORF Transcript_11447/g.25113 Transcript_11447/m.25113 type:complete len:266 (-) Transcript_11447:31-828(-)